MKKFPQKESSRISLDPLIQKNWCLWYDWQLSWWLSCQIRQNDWQHRRSCRTWSAKLCILIYVAPPIVLHFNHVAAEKLLLMCAKNCQIWLRRFKNRSKTVRWSRFFWTTLWRCTLCSRTVMHSSVEFIYVVVMQWWQSVADPEGEEFLYPPLVTMALYVVVLTFKRSLPRQPVCIQRVCACLCHSWQWIIFCDPH